MTKFEIKDVGRFVSMFREWWASVEKDGKAIEPLYILYGWQSFDKKKHTGMANGNSQKHKCYT